MEKDTHCGVEMTPVMQSAVLSVAPEGPRYNICECMYGGDTHKNPNRCVYQNCCFQTTEITIRLCDSHGQKLDRVPLLTESC